MHRKQALWLLSAAVIGFGAGLAAAQRKPEFPPHRPTPGPTVSVPRKKERYPIVLEDRVLTGPKGLLFHTGNILFPVFPVETVVTAVAGQATPTAGATELRACGRSVNVRWAEPGQRPNIQVTGAPGQLPPRPRWPLRAGEFDQTRPLDPLAGVWLHRGQAMASSDWLWQVLGIHTEFREPGLTIQGCLAPDGTPHIPENTLTSCRFVSRAYTNPAKIWRNRTARGTRGSLPSEPCLRPSRSSSGKNAP